MRHVDQVIERILDRFRGVISDQHAEHDRREEHAQRGDDRVPNNVAEADDSLESSCVFLTVRSASSKMAVDLLIHEDGSCWR